MFILRLIANNLAPLTLLAAVAAYFVPELFLPVKPLISWFFGATMLALGVVLNPDELKETLNHPGQIGIGVITQYTVMPLAGFAAAWISGLPPALALGLIIVGCAPGAMASNVIVYLAGGAVAYSVALTTVSTLLAPLLTPALVKLLGGVFMPVPFWLMVQTILFTALFPLLAGMASRRLLGERLTLATELAPAVAALAIVVICGYVVAANQARLGEIGPTLFALVVLVNALGYITGWQLARLFRFDPSRRLALSIEIGMQNAGLGAVLALQHFDPETALPGALFATWCILTAAGATAYLRRRAAPPIPAPLP
ncbi:bile acid:sodium symporter family protein [Endothiovibrio diazotrophicus]